MSLPLEKIIRQTIVENGPMDIATYMSLCLTHPLYGYYTNAEQVFGARGDFTTAPEMSQLFGEMIGFWVADVWAGLGKPDPFILAELGPGRGTLMADILRILSRLSGLSRCARIHLVEVSERRMAEQAASLRGYDVTWHTCVGDLPHDVPMIVVSNEFFDAIPVHQLIRDEQGVSEVVVGMGVDGSLELGRSRACFPFADVPPDGAWGVFEQSPERKVVARTVFSFLQGQRGAVLTLDYGYDRPVWKSTLQAVKNHERVGFLESPGQVDLTALVDFGALGDLAKGMDLSVAGPVGQGAFLTTLGISARAQKILECAEVTKDQRRDVLSALYRLTEESEMGSLFRVLCVYNAPLSFIPAGFS